MNKQQAFSLHRAMDRIGESALNLSFCLAAFLTLYPEQVMEEDEHAQKLVLAVEENLVDALKTIKRLKIVLHMDEDSHETHKG